MKGFFLIFHQDYSIVFLKLSKYIYFYEIKQMYNGTL